MSKVKAIILGMSCNEQFFLDSEKIVRDTWAKDILEDKYPNLSFYFFREGDKDYIDKENNIIYVENTGDDLDSTFRKSKNAFKLVKDNLEYDYIIRINLSTYLNVKLLNDILEIMKDNNDNHVWGGELVYLKDEYFISGKCYIFSRDNINKILSSPKEYEIIPESDDVIYGHIFDIKDYAFFEPAYINYAPGHPYNHDLKNITPEFVAQHLIFSYRQITNFLPFLNKEAEYDFRRKIEFKSAYELHELYQNININTDTLLKFFTFKLPFVFDANTMKFKSIP